MVAVPRSSEVYTGNKFPVENWQGIEINDTLGNAYSVIQQLIGQGEDKPNHTGDEFRNLFYSAQVADRTIAGDYIDMFSAFYWASGLIEMVEEVADGVSYSARYNLRV